MTNKFSAEKQSLNKLGIKGLDSGRLIQKRDGRNAGYSRFAGPERASCNNEVTVFTQ